MCKYNVFFIILTYNTCYNKRIGTLERKSPQAFSNDNPASVCLGLYRIKKTPLVTLLQVIQ